MPSVAVLIFCFLLLPISLKLMKDIKQGYEISVHMDGCVDVERHNVWVVDYKCEESHFNSY